MLTANIKQTNTSIPCNDKYSWEISIVADSSHWSIINNITECMQKTPYLTGFQDLYVFLEDSVPILLNEAFNLVLNIVCKMVNDKRSRWHPRLFEVAIMPMFAVQLLTPVLIGAIWHLNNRMHTRFHRLRNIKQISITQGIQTLEL